jgi:hypothetical protein
MRLLFESETSFGHDVVEHAGWHFGSVPALGLTWAEGRPGGDALGLPADVLSAGNAAREFVGAHVGVRRDRGVARLDVTTTRAFEREADARAFFAGMAALDMPRCETTRRGRPVHSIAWTHAAGRRILARAYDKGLERGGEPWRSGRLEDQGRFRSGSRPPLDVVADPAYQRERFERRFRPMAQALDGVKAATFPVIAQSLADEARYGYRSVREAARLAGALVLFAGGVQPSRDDRTLYRWRRELREAGYVVVDDEREAVDVDLGGELEQALMEFGR